MSDLNAALAEVSDEFKAMGWDAGLGLDAVKRDADRTVIATRASDAFVRDVETATETVRARQAPAELVRRHGNG